MDGHIHVIVIVGYSLGLVHLDTVGSTVHPFTGSGSLEHCRVYSTSIHWVWFT